MFRQVTLQSKNLSRLLSSAVGYGSGDPDAAMKAWIGNAPYADYHARKMDRLFQESTGQTAVTASADKIGLALDGAQFQGKTLSEFVAGQPELKGGGVVSSVGTPPIAPSYNTATGEGVASRGASSSDNGGVIFTGLNAAKWYLVDWENLSGTGQLSLRQYTASLIGTVITTLSPSTRQQSIVTGSTGFAISPASNGNNGNFVVRAFKEIPGFHGENATAAQRLNMLVAPLYDQAKIDAMSELATNGKFDANINGWSSAFGGVLAWDTGRLSLTQSGSGGGAVGTGLSVVAGKTYMLSADIVSTTASNPSIFLASNTDGTIIAGTQVFGVGTARKIGWLATFTGTVYPAFGAQGTTGTTLFDNASVKEVPADAISDRYTITGDGTDDNLLTTWLAAAGGNTVFFDVDVPATGAGAQIFCGSFDGVPGRLFIGFELATTGRLSFGLGGAYYGSYGTVDFRGKRCVGALTHDGSVIRAFTTLGGQEYSGAMSGVLPTAMPFRIGANNANGNPANHFAGGIARIVPVQKGGLTLADWQTIGPQFAKAS